MTALLALGAPLFAAPPADSRVEVVFENPDKFADVRESLTSPANSRDYYLELIRQHLQRRAPQHLAEGQKLTVTFTNIDMAGEFEPGRGQNSNTRLIKDVYPARMKFSYRVTDASGAVVKEGAQDIIDTGFQMRGNATRRHDTLFHEKALLDEWLRNEFKGQKSAARKS